MKTCLSPLLKTRRLIALLASFNLVTTTLAQDESAKVYCFEKDSDGSEHHVMLRIESGQVRGSQTSGDENATASGSLRGIVREDGVLHLTYHYSIEDQLGAEEQLMKIEKTRLLIGEGELEEHGPGQLVLKSPKDVKFTTALKQVPLTFPAVESADGKAITKAVIAGVKDQIEVTIGIDGGDMRMAGSWAVYEGFLVLPKDQKPADPLTAESMAHRQFQGLLKRDVKGRWQMVAYTFANDAGSFDPVPAPEGRAPWQLFEKPE